jgi:hypothetical protein
MLVAENTSQSAICRISPLSSGIAASKYEERKKAVTIAAIQKIHNFNFAFLILNNIIVVKKMQKNEIAEMTGITPNIASNFKYFFMIFLLLILYKTLSQIVISSTMAQNYQQRRFCFLWHIGYFARGMKAYILSIHPLCCRRYD